MISDKVWKGWWVVPVVDPVVCWANLPFSAEALISKASGDSTESSGRCSWLRRTASSEVTLPSWHSLHLSTSSYGVIKLGSLASRQDYVSGSHVSEMGFPGPKLRCQVAVFLFGSSRGESYSLCFPALMTTLLPLWWLSSFIFKDSNSEASPSAIRSFWPGSSACPFPIFKDPCNYTGSTQLIKNHLPILRSTQW